MATYTSERKYRVRFTGAISVPELVINFSHFGSNHSCNVWAIEDTKAHLTRLHPTYTHAYLYTGIEDGEEAARLMGEFRSRIDVEYVDFT